MIKIIQLIEVGYKSILCGFCALFTVGFIYYMFYIVDKGMTYKDEYGREKRIPSKNDDGMTYKKDKSEREG